MFAYTYGQCVHIIAHVLEKHSNLFSCAPDRLTRNIVHYLAPLIYIYEKNQNSYLVFSVA